MGDMADAQIDEMDASWGHCCKHCGEDYDSGDCLCFDDDGKLKAMVKPNKAFNDYWKARGIPTRFLK